MSIKIYGLNKTTLLDYPGRVAATIFLGGCNFRCPFCHNSSLVNQTGQPMYSVDEVLNFLSKRKNILKGVCISGGEPTIHPELGSFLSDIRALGYEIKLDTNGYCPDKLADFMQDHLVDTIAMDIKNSPSAYAITAGLSSLDVNRIFQSVDLIRSSGLPYEFRTTLVKELHQEQCILEIGQWLTGCDAYFLQSYEDSGDILCPNLHPLDKETLYHFRDILLPFVPSVKIRGVE